MVALLAFVAMFLFRMFTRKSGGNTGSAGNNGFTPQPAYASAAEPSVYTPEIGSRIEPVGVQAPAPRLGNNEFGSSPASASPVADDGSRLDCMLWSPSKTLRVMLPRLLVRPLPP